MAPTESEIFDKVREALVDALGVEDDEVTPDATLVGDLGAESIDFLDIVFRLEKTFGVLVRSGLHCSPGSHRTLGTFPEGTVRVSPGPVNTRREISGFLAAIGTIAASRRGAPPVRPVFPARERE